ncbi:hypothetical protein ACFQZQ_12120 [Lysobacter koreensis]|uniref:Uncharacterized protein n=1 Tax=Lysobacter koreensis TaxID=266122 RepID=A0ABW2YQ57_9GAMM
MKSSVWMLAALVAAGMAHASAATPELHPMPDTTVATSAADVATAAPTACCRIAAGTVVELEITEPVSSSRHKRGDRFGLRLHAPLTLAGATAIPAGVIGVGEIVHAAAARGGGKPGELLLAARHLEHGSVQWPLRGLKLGSSGKDSTAAALGAALVIGPFAHFIRGHEIEIPAGTRVNAKLAQDVVLPATAAPNPPITVTNQE